MNTDELVALLSTNPEPVDRGSVVRMLGAALAAGTVVALCITVFGLGVRPDLMTPRPLLTLVVKLAFTVGIVSLALASLTRLSRPGGEKRTPAFLVAIPFLVIGVLAAINLGLAPVSHWDDMIVGYQWRECVLAVPLIAIIPFAISMWVLRREAPTTLMRTGAVVGLFAGGMSASAYALHCNNDSLPYIAVWYGGTILLCALAGAALGPRWLRW